MVDSRPLSELPADQRLTWPLPVGFAEKKVPMVRHKGEVAMPPNEISNHALKM